MRRSIRVAALVCSLLAGASFALAEGSGSVYVLTNAAAGNAVLVYDRGHNGGLTPAGSFATGGAGTGAGLGSQGAVIVSEDQRFLFAVNAGSNSIAAFRVESDGLKLVDVEPSNGRQPTSLAYRSGLLYVLNAGIPNNVSGFIVDRRGRLSPLADSTRSLSGPSTQPAQVSFTDDADALIVTERATNLIDVIDLERDGRPGAQTVVPSAGPTPFGFAVSRRDTLLISEAGAGGGASTYRFSSRGGLDPVSSMIMTGQRAACWAVITGNGRYGYVTNAGTGNISGFRLRRDGSAALLNADGVTAITGGNPSDVALSRDSRYLYARVAALNVIAVFRLEADGALTPLPPLTGTPAGLAGLAAF